MATQFVSFPKLIYASYTYCNYVLELSITELQKPMNLSMTIEFFSMKTKLNALE